MRRVNACPRLDEAGVVVVAAGRQHMILSSGALVLGTDLPAHARTDSNLISLLPSRWALVWRSHKFRYGLSRALFGWNSTGNSIACLRQCAPSAGIVPSKVWQEWESSSPDSAHFSGQVEHRQCKSALGVSPRHSSARSNRKRICICGNHGRSNLG